jgi:predicted HicB family RNase H-like nuclease
MSKQSKHPILKKLASTRKDDPSEIPLATRISKRLHARIVEEAERQGVTISTLVRDVLREVFLEETE